MHQFGLNISGFKCISEKIISNAFWFNLIIHAGNNYLSDYPISFLLKFVLKIRGKLWWLDVKVVEPSKLKCNSKAKTNPKHCLSPTLWYNLSWNNSVSVKINFKHWFKPWFLNVFRVPWLCFKFFFILILLQLTLIKCQK